MTGDQTTEEAMTIKKRRPKRAHGEGSLYFDAKQQLYVGELTVGRRPDGKLDRRKVKAKTQRECRVKLQQLRQHHSANSLREPNRVTVRQFFTDWLENTVKARRKASTYSHYESLIRVHALPSLGGKYVKDVQTRHLDDLYRQLEQGTNAQAPKGRGRTRAARGLAPKTIRGLHVALHSGFERAVRRNLTPRNPADGVELPSAPRRKKLNIDVADIQWLLQDAIGRRDRFASLWTFLANTGLRIGEALALRWANVDLDGGWFTIEENLGRDGAVSGTKTQSGEREVPLTASALAALKAHRVVQNAERLAAGEKYVHRDLVFATSVGSAFSERNALRALKRSVRHANETLADDAKLPDSLCLHDLRRMTASLLVASGVDIATAAAIMGHKNASILLDVYASALRGQKAAAAEKLQQALYGR